nr:hypothetical protein [Tanacetum cinerariifolium]
YIPGPEEPEQAPPSPNYVPGPEHADDEIVAEDQPYAEDASPIAQSPEYVPESDFEAHPEDDDDEDPKEDHVDYLTDGGDDGDDEEEISIPAPVPMPAWTDSEIPFPSLPPILSPPSPALSPAPPPSPICSLGYRAAMIRLRDEAASTSSPPLQLPSASRREDRPEVTLPPQKRLGIDLGPKYEVGESSSVATARLAGGLRADYGFVTTVYREIMRNLEREVGYGITNSWDKIVETLQGAPVSIDTELGGYMREDRCAHAYTRHLMEKEARMSQGAWVRATYASDLVHGEVMSLRTTVLGQMSEIRELQAADCRRQTVISELLRIDHRRSIEITELRTALQGQVTALQGQVIALQAHVTTLQGQQGLAGGLTQPELPEQAGGSS